MRRNVKIAAMLILFVVGFSLTLSHAQDLPVGTWDVKITGTTLGAGYITFDSEFNELFGYLCIVPNSAVKPPKRPAVVNFGLFFFSGKWDSQNRKVTGFFSGGSEEIPLDVRSFSGVFRAGRSINLVGTTNNGPMHLVGVPASVLGDPTGFYRADVVRDKKKSVEFLDLGDSGFLNLFTVAGVGSTFIAEGSMLLSRGGRICLNSEERHVDQDTGEPEPEGSGLVRTLLGNINLRTGRGKLSGTDEENGKIGMTLIRE
ncbi:MAG: hypothetical protein HY695_18470 [Deltaproteobacteria bacterium]|nr:hypothetical protein [Deltaproteobacteria bacterium]